MHYKEQFMKTLQELALLKKREDANARALLRKQQIELEQLKMRYLGDDEVENVSNRKNFQDE